MAGRYRYRLLLLREWRRVAARVVEAVRRLYPEAEVYLIGGVAEGRITVDSDLDIAVVFKTRLSRDERVDVLARVLESIEDVVPMYYPLEIHVLEAGELERLKGGKVRLSPST